jgi:hypothetical protein
MPGTRMRFPCGVSVFQDIRLMIAPGMGQTEDFQ